MKIIEVTDEMYDALIVLSKEINEQDNRATAMPYFFQIQTKQRVPAVEGAGKSAWHLDGGFLDDDDEINTAIYEYFEEEKPIDEVKKISEFEKDEILEKMGYTKIWYDYDEKYENAFLTAKACKEHIQANKHHYRQPNDFLTHAFRNPELELVYKFLCELTNGKLHK